MVVPLRYHTAQILRLSTSLDSISSQFNRIRTKNHPDSTGKDDILDPVLAVDFQPQQPPTSYGQMADSTTGWMEDIIRHLDKIYSG